jgi:hypothetical protein
VQQEQGVAGLGGDTGDAADGQVGAAGSVQEIQVDVDRRAVPAQADGQLPIHLVEVQRVFSVVPGGAAHRLAGSGRDVAFRLDPGGGDLRGFLHPGRQHAVADQEHIGAETGALVPGGDFGDDTGDRHLTEPRHRSAGDDDIVELQVGILVQGDVEAQRGGVLGAEHAADRCRRVDGDRPVRGAFGQRSPWCAAPGEPDVDVPGDRIGSAPPGGPGE